VVESGPACLAVTLPQHGENRIDGVSECLRISLDEVAHRAGKPVSTQLEQISQQAGNDDISRFPPLEGLQQPFEAFTKIVGHLDRVEDLPQALDEFFHGSPFHIQPGPRSAATADRHGHPSSPCFSIDERHRPLREM
jgi:hypothetical protein